MPNLVIERGCQEFYRQMWTQQEALARGAAATVVPALTALTRQQVNGSSPILVSEAVLGEVDGAQKIGRASRLGTGPLYESTRVSIDLAGKPRATYPAVPIRTKLFAAPQSGAFGWAVFTQNELTAMRRGLGLEDDDPAPTLRLDPSDPHPPALFSPYEMMLPTFWVRDFLILFSDNANQQAKDEAWDSLKPRRFIPWLVYGLEPNARAFFSLPWLDQYICHEFTDTNRSFVPRLKTALAANQGHCVLEVLHDTFDTGLRVHIPLSSITRNQNTIKTLCVDVFTVGAAGLHWEEIEVDKASGKKGAAEGRSETLPKIDELPAEFEAFLHFLRTINGGRFVGFGTTDSQGTLQVGPYRLGAKPYKQFHLTPNKDYRIELEIEGDKLVIKYALLNKDGKKSYSRRSSIDLSEASAVGAKGASKPGTAEDEGAGVDTQDPPRRFAGSLPKSRGRLHNLLNNLPDKTMRGIIIANEKGELRVGPFILNLTEETDWECSFSNSPFLVILILALNRLTIRVLHSDSRGRIIGDFDSQYTFSL